MQTSRSPQHAGGSKTVGKTFWNIKRILVIGGLILLVIAGYEYEGIRRYLGEAVATEGTVITATKSGPANDVSHTVIVRFTTRNGASIDFRPPLLTNPDSYKQGNKVKVYYLPSNPRNARTDIWGNVVFNAAIGALLLIVAGIMTLISKRKNSHAGALRSRGRQLVTRVQKVELNRNLSVGGVNPYIIWSRWEDPVTGKTHLFKSDNLWFDPTHFVAGKTVSVYMAADNPDDYFMDLSFLPKNAPYQALQEDKTPVPVPKKATKLGRRAKIVLAFIVFVWITMAIGMWKSNPQAAITGLFMLFFVVFFVAMMIWTVYQLSKILGFKCPQCRTRIRKPVDDGGKDDVPIFFYCEKCDILWDSGVRTPSSST